MSDEDRLRWNAKYESGDHASVAPSTVLTELASLLPSNGRALDIAGGAGRNAIWLAERGLDVTLVDVSDVALKIAESRATQARFALSTCCCDVESDLLPAGPWDLVVIVHFLWRPLLAKLPQILASGGTFVCIHPTQSNLQRHAKPPARFLLDDHELPNLVCDLNVVHYNEEWSSEGRHEAVLVARANGSQWGVP